MILDTVAAADGRIVILISLDGALVTAISDEVAELASIANDTALQRRTRPLGFLDHGEKAMTARMCGLLSTPGFRVDLTVMSCQTDDDDDCPLPDYLVGLDACLVVRDDESARVEWYSAAATGAGSRAPVPDIAMLSSGTIHRSVESVIPSLLGRLRFCNGRATPHQLLAHGDCLTILRGLPADCADVVMTSPPYNIKVAYNSYFDKLPENQYLNGMRCVFREMHRVLHQGGSLFLNVAGRPSRAVTALRLALMVSEYFVLQNQIIWVKSIHVGRRTYGHFKPINSHRYLNGTHEPVFHFTKSGSVPLDRLAVGVPYTDESNVRRWSHGADLHCNGNTWFIPYPTKRCSLPHPATFPVELPERCILLHGVDRCRLVVDPFGGLGSTTRAAIRCGVNSLSIEMDEEYHRVACLLAEAEAA